MAAREDIRSRIIGNSPVFKEVLERAERAAKAPTKITTGLHGRRGTGKELIAKLIHDLSTPDGPFVAINCAAISPGIAESEFFGHDAGAFTGATKVSIGAFERANGGTLFLDEIHTLPLEIQSKLLRVLQEMEFQRVGSGRVRKLNVRIITAWNCDLEAMCRSGDFKQDLYDRINIYVIKLPSLHERRDDILPIARHLLQDIALQKTFSSEAEHFLENNIYPGNIRVMRNLIWAAVVDAGESEVVGLEHIKQNLEGKLPGHKALSISRNPAPTTLDLIEGRNPQKEAPVFTLPKAMNADVTKKTADLDDSQQKNQTPEISVPTKLSNHERQHRLIELIETNGPIKTADIRKKTGIPKTTLQNTLNRLIEEGLIDRHKTPRHFYYFQYEQNPPDTELNTYAPQPFPIESDSTDVPIWNVPYPHMDDRLGFQTWILNTLSEKGVATAAELGKIAQTSRSSITRCLNELIENGKVQRIGKGKRIQYILADAQDLPSADAGGSPTQQTGQAEPFETGQAAPSTGQVNPLKYKETPIQTGQAEPPQTRQAESQTGQVEQPTEHALEPDDSGIKMVPDFYTEKISPTSILTKRHQEMVEFAENEPQSLKSLMQFMNLNHRESFMKKWLRPLLDAGLLTMTIPDKPNSPKQRYEANLRTRDGPKNRDP
jgi:DNA-binding NtrC family response regulator